jgi:long-chain acyl-CoA synthetase
MPSAAASLLERDDKGISPFAVRTKRPQPAVDSDACMKCGLVAMPLNYRYMPPEIDHALGVGGARILLAHDGRRDDLAASKLAAKLSLGRISYDDIGGSGSQSFRSLTEGGLRRDCVPPKPEDPAMQDLIQFARARVG